jgi:hypothetical protein
MRELRALSRRCDLTEAGLNEAAATALSDAAPDVPA